MAFPILYAEEKEQVHRQSSIDQFNGFLSKWKQGGPAPVVFDKIDGIHCNTIKSHPVVIDLRGDSLGYVYPEAHCTFLSEKFITVTKEGVEQKILPSIFGGNGELIDVYTNKDAFVNFTDSSLGVRNRIQLRTGLSVVKAKETLPAVD